MRASILRLTLCSTLFFALFYVSCENYSGGGGINESAADPYYICGSEKNREELTGLFGLLANKDYSGEERFAIIREIANNYVKQKEYPRLINFLTSAASENPADPYNAYFLFMTGWAYMQGDAGPVATLYFDMIIKNYPDLTVSGKSVHLACLERLIDMTENNERKIRYYEELISRFRDRIDPGPAYFMLGRSYERVGDWTGAIRAYTRFLPYVNSNVPGFPNAAVYAKQLVDFNNSSKNWSFDSLASLVGAVRAALDAVSPARLEQCRAKVNFFARSWEQESNSGDEERMADFNLADFMRERIRYADTLDSGSNANEAYLRTWRWSGNISTWYLYFRKIYFPSDPEIHGRWEWAGVYYGEKF